MPRLDGCPLLTYARSGSTSNIQTLESSSFFYKALLDSSFDAIVVTDVKGVIRKVNESAVQMFRYPSAESMIGQNVSILCSAVHREKHDIYMKACARRMGGAAASPAVGHLRDERAARADGTEFPCRLGIQIVKVPPDQSNNNRKSSNKNLMQDADDNVLLVGYIRDVTAEKQA